MRNPCSLIYFVISLTLNVFLTATLVSRLLRYKTEMQTVLGSDYGKHYNTLAIVFIESALMNVICSLGLVVSDIPLYSSFLWSIYDEGSLGGIVFYIFVAITPAVQVWRPSQVNLNRLNDTSL